ncbi:hypothetical protein C5167_047864 [Papaver somniferum]|uniref:Water stress and hypersensitive response domain-containing protein n=1 Tax=Papaver somniferum TaxID=3469 RepID=A0A4Y7LK53_PAPSO|nr:desiccation protectant protein Lea14 homolog [Papaver somniferum]RZC85082.1 hypothetical protein C5167_047864 [Papaver somniferum]
MAELFDKAKNFVADKVGAIKKPEADLDVDISKMGLHSVTLMANISITNPYSHSIPICEVRYTLFSAGKEILSGTMPDPGDIEEKDVTLLKVPVKVPYNMLMTIAKDLGRDWDIDYEVKVDLIVDLPIFGNITIPLSKKGEIKLPTASSLFGGGDDDSKDKNDDE